jgi:hypothetical protein
MTNNSEQVRPEETNESHELLVTLRQDIEDHKKVIEDRDKRGFVVKVVLPILSIILTAVLGLLVWFFENRIETKADENNRNIQAKVEENNRLLSTRLALTEEFYRRKLNAYEKTCTLIVSLADSLERYDGREVNPEVGAQANDSMAAVDQLSKSDFLYLSPKFKDQLGDLWQMGVDRMDVDRMANRGQDSLDMKKKLNQQIKNLRDEMNADLHTSDLNWLPRSSAK